MPIQKTRSRITLFLPLRIYSNVCTQRIELPYQNNPHFQYFKNKYLFFKIQDGLKNASVVLEAIIMEAK